MSRIFDLNFVTSFAASSTERRNEESGDPGIWAPSTNKFVGVSRSGNIFFVPTVADIINYSMLNTNYIGAKQMIVTILGIGYGNNFISRFKNSEIFGAEVYDKIVDLYSGIFGNGKYEESEEDKKKFVEIWNRQEDLVDPDDIEDERAYLDTFINLFAFSEIAKVWDAIATSMKAGLKWEELAKTPINVWYYSDKAIGFTAPKIAEAKRVDVFSDLNKLKESSKVLENAPVNNGI